MRGKKEGHRALADSVRWTLRTYQGVTGSGSKGIASHGKSGSSGKGIVSVIVISMIHVAAVLNDSLFQKHALFAQKPAAGLHLSLAGPDCGAWVFNSDCQHSDCLSYLTGDPQRLCRTRTSVGLEALPDGRRTYFSQLPTSGREGVRCHQI